MATAITVTGVTHTPSKVKRETIYEIEKPI
jgi:hypothetical protein